MEVTCAVRAAYDALVERLCEPGGGSLSGEQVRALVEELGCREDLDRRNLERAAFL